MLFPRSDELVVDEWNKEWRNTMMKQSIDKAFADDLTTPSPSLQPRFHAAAVIKRPLVDPDAARAVDARQGIGPDWQKVMTKGPGVTC